MPRSAFKTSLTLPCFPAVALGMCCMPRHAHGFTFEFSVEYDITRTIYRSSVHVLLIELAVLHTVYLSLAQIFVFVSIIIYV